MLVTQSDCEPPFERDAVAAKQSSVENSSTQWFSSSVPSIGPVVVSNTHATISVSLVNTNTPKNIK